MSTEFLKQQFSLEGFSGIVTGTSGGLGFAMAEALANAGATVHGLSRSGDGPNNVDHHACDLTDAARTQKVFETIGGESGIDFLINNAGVTKKEKFQTLEESEVRRILDLNIDSVMRCCRLAYPFLKESRLPGRVVTVSSMAAHLGFSEVVPYAVSKTAMLGLTRGLAVEWADDNILVNSVAPGWFPSNMTQGVMDEERKAKILSRMPLHRFGKPEELASMILFLVSPAATYITGQDFAVDGGALAFGY